jgi:hypothetical protein
MQLAAVTTAPSPFTVRALPSSLPAAAAVVGVAAFPDALASGDRGMFTGQVATGAGDVGSADPSLMVNVGSDFLPAVSAAVQQARAGLLASNLGVEADDMLGLFQAKAGSYYVAPMTSAQSDEGELLQLHVGDTLTALAPQLVAVVSANAWADLRAAQA